MSNETLSTGDRPTDLELMLYADGELDEPRRAAVEAWLRRDAVGRRKIASLRVGSRLVRQGALRRAAKADGIADAVMAKLDAPANAPWNVADAVMAKLDAPAKESAELPSNVVPLRRPASEARVEPSAAKPANDGARKGRVFAIATAALAAAAAFAIWIRASHGPEPIAQSFPTATSATVESGEVTSPLPSPNGPEPANDGEVEPAVEVAAVDFGARMGAVFYVPTGAAASHQTTTVVWLNDDSAGGE